MLIVACVETGDYQGRGIDYVTLLRDSVARRLSLPHRFVCFTDRDAIAGVECRPIADGLRGWWAKLWLFAPGAVAAGDRVIYLDLDTLIVGAIDDLAGYDGDFAILRDFRRPGGYGSGAMLWRGGFGAAIWSVWNEAGRPELHGGDQAWIERACPEADRLQDRYPGAFVSFKDDCGDGLPDGARVVCFHGRPKPHVLPAAHWAARQWRGEPVGMAS